MTRLFILLFYFLLATAPVADYNSDEATIVIRKTIGGKDAAIDQARFYLDMNCTTVKILRIDTADSTYYQVEGMKFFTQKSPKPATMPPKIKEN